jgi:VWFA-related protein
MMPRTPRRISSLAAGLLLAALAHAQAPAGPQAPQPGAPQLQRPAKDDAQIRVRVDLVTTPVTVRDSAGHQVYDLNGSEFRVLDNGVEQKIERFEMGGVPLSVVILLESSSRVEPLLENVRRTGIVFTQTVLGETGEAAVLSVDDTIEVLQDFTANHDHIEQKFRQLRMGTSGLRLYDALGRAVEMLTTRSPDRRRVIIAVSEATDTASQIPLGEVLRQAQLNNVTIYGAGLSTTAAKLRSDSKSTGAPSATPPGILGRPGPPGTVQTPGTEATQHGNINVIALAKILVERGSSIVADNSLEVAAAATGGMHRGGFKDSALERAISEIGGELHSQYLVSYRPAGVPAGGYHEIEIRVRRPNLRVRARPGYYLPADSGSGK